MSFNLIPRRDGKLIYHPNEDRDQGWNRTHRTTTKVRAQSAGFEGKTTANKNGPEASDFLMLYFVLRKAPGSTPEAILGASLIVAVLYRLEMTSKVLCRGKDKWSRDVT